MKLAILRNPDVIEKNQYRIRTQRPKVSKDLLVSSNAQKKRSNFVALCYLFLASWLWIWYVNAFIQHSFDLHLVRDLEPTYLY